VELNALPLRVGPLHEQLNRLDDLIAAIAQLPVAGAAPNSGNAAIGEFAVKELVLKCGDAGSADPSGGILCPLRNH
jgi:hypothetical protein